VIFWFAKFFSFFGDKILKVQKRFVLIVTSFLIGGLFICETVIAASNGARLNISELPTPGSNTCKAVFDGQPNPTVQDKVWSEFQNDQTLTRAFLVMFFSLKSDNPSDELQLRILTAFTLLEKLNVSDPKSGEMLTEQLAEHCKDFTEPKWHERVISI
jgi:hypothetical protein